MAANNSVGKLDTIGRDKVFVSNEVNAEYPVGNEALMIDLARNSRYPAMAVEKRFQGRVYVSFIVEKDGSLSNIKVLKGAELGRVLHFHWRGNKSKNFF